MHEFFRREPTYNRTLNTATDSRCLTVPCRDAVLNRATPPVQSSRETHAMTATQTATRANQTTQTSQTSQTSRISQPAQISHNAQTTKTNHANHAVQATPKTAQSTQANQTNQTTRSVSPTHTHKTVFAAAPPNAPTFIDSIRPPETKTAKSPVVGLEDLINAPRVTAKAQPLKQEKKIDEKTKIDKTDRKITKIEKRSKKFEKQAARAEKLARKTERQQAAKVEKQFKLAKERTKKTTPHRAEKTLKIKPKKISFQLKFGRSAEHAAKTAKLKSGQQIIAIPAQLSAATKEFLEEPPALKPMPLKPASILTTQTTNMTEKVLATAATIDQPNAPARMPLTVNNSGTTTITNGHHIGKVNKLAAAKITFSVTIKRKQLFAIFRTILILTILAVSGYLAWDTWVTHRDTYETPSRPVSTYMINSIASVDESSPNALDTTSVSTQAQAAHTAPADQPRYISIPAIGVKNARVFSVGVNSDGNIDLAKNANDAAWYDGSAKPGQNGAVFINGHTSFSRSFRGLFDNLSALNIGDKIMIERGDGQTLTYAVVEQEVVPRDQVDINKALNPQNGATQGMTLMTYAGEYDYANGGAQDRAIVYAVLE